MADNALRAKFSSGDTLTLFLFCVAGPIIGIAYWGLFTQGPEGLLAPLFVAFAIGILPSAALPMIAVLGLIPALASAITDIAARRRYQFQQSLAITAAVGGLTECIALFGTGMGLLPEMILSAFATALSCSILAKWVRNQVAREAPTH